MKPTIKLSEEGVFYTIQGEGRFIGYPTTFVRLTACNLRCAWKNQDGSITKCDTPHTSFDWLRSHKDEIDCQTLAQEIHNKDCEHVCISGGEPFIQPALADLVQEIKRLGKHFVTVETNGTIYRPTTVDFVTISPKLASSNNHDQDGWLERHNRNRINFDALEQFITNHDFQFKFVINSEDDVKEIESIRKILWERTAIDINDRIWVMPQGTSVNQFDSKLEFMAEMCKNRSWKLTDRLHIRIWGAKKGV